MALSLPLYAPSASLLSLLNYLLWSPLVDPAEDLSTYTPDVTYFNDNARNTHHLAPPRDHGSLVTTLDSTAPESSLLSFHLTKIQLL